MTKTEFKKLIKESKKEERKSGFSNYSKIISNNKDSVFFKSDKIKIYSTQEIVYKKEFCRTIELKFLNNKKVNFIDCQTCVEPSSCYVSTDKNIYQYQIKEIDKELYLFFKNKYNEMNFKIVSSIKNKLNWRIYYKLELNRIK